MNDSLHSQLKQSVDNAGGAGTADQAEGKIREVVGQGQQALGEALGDENLRAKGTTTELQGKAQQVGGLVQEKAEEFGEKVSANYHEAVENAKAGASDLLDRAKTALQGDKTTTTTTPVA